MAGSGKKNRDSRRQWLIVLLLLVLLFVLLSLGKRGFIQQYRIRS